MRARLIKTQSSYHGLREYIFPWLFLVPYSLLKTKSFLSSSTHLINKFSSKAILISDATNMLEIFRCCIYQNKIIKIYNNKKKIYQKHFIVITKNTSTREFKGKQLPPNG